MFPLRTYISFDFIYSACDHIIFAVYLPYIAALASNETVLKSTYNVIRYLQ